MSLETDLKDALRRVPAPEGFTERVMARVEEGRSRLSGQERVPILHWWRAVAATLLLAAILGGWGGHELLERRREREGQRARDQVLLALRITGEKLAHAERGIRHITR